jgi:hypothetical protein
MNSLKYVKNDSTGDLWIVADDPNKPIMYINKNGILHLPNDVIAFAKLPPIPPQDETKDKDVTTANEKLG